MKNNTISGFVYEWTDTLTGLKYIGKHEGVPNDGYIGSGTVFKKEYSTRPNDFIRKILWESSDTTIDQLALVEHSFLDSIPENELYFGSSRKYYNIVKNSSGYTSENNPMKNPKMVSQMLETRKIKGTHKNQWERLVEKYGYDEACLINKRKMLGNKNGSSNKGKTKSEEHKKKISESIKNLAKDPNRNKSKNVGRKPVMSFEKTIEIFQNHGLKEGSKILGISEIAFKSRYYTAKKKLTSI